MKNVVIIDYGMGNLFSIAKAFETCGAKVALSSDKNEIINAERLVLPGVGAFGDGMRELEKRDLVAPIKEAAEMCKPILGICLGMQMLMDIGEEFGEHKGLGLIHGRVSQIPKINSAGEKVRIPHIGWNSITKFNNVNWENTIMQGISEGEFFYFVHSFRAEPSDKNNCLAVANYNKIEITSIINKDKIFGCQFHPEKSGKIGLKIIENFINL